MVHTYNEFKVVYNDDKIIDKTPTARKQVRISEKTAATNNFYSKSTGLLYEKENKPVKKATK